MTQQNVVTITAVSNSYRVGLTDERTGEWEDGSPYIMDKRQVLSVWGEERTVPILQILGNSMTTAPVPKDSSAKPHCHATNKARNNKHFAPLIIQNDDKCDHMR